MVEKMNNFKYLIATTIFLCISQGASAGLIEQSSVDGATRQIKYFSDIGQTFTAEDASIESIGFWVTDFNSQSNPFDFDLTVSLYEGVGSSGTLLGSTINSTLTDNYSGFLDFDFSAVTLNVGSIYTALINNDTSRWGLASNQHTYTSGPARNAYDYSGGHLILSGALDTHSDATFRVTPTISSVSEPASLSLLGLGVIGLVAVRRKKA